MDVEEYKQVVLIHLHQKDLCSDGHEWTGSIDTDTTLKFNTLL